MVLQKQKLSGQKCVQLSFSFALKIRAPRFAGRPAVPESGAKDTRSPDASRLPDTFKLRKASGLRRVHRRFLRVPGLA